MYFSQTIIAIGMSAIIWRSNGYIVMYFTEIILGRPINQNLQYKLIQIGVFLLMFLMILITFFDIQKLFF